MNETEFFKVVEATLARPYKDNAAYYEDYFRLIDEKLAAPRGVFTLETLAELEALKVRLMDKKAADLAPVIGASFTRQI